MASKQRKKTTTKKPKTTKAKRRVNSGRVQSTGVPKELKPTLLAYNAQYEGNPLLPVLQKLYDSGRLKLDMDERRYLADLLVEEISNQAELSGLGAPIIRRMINWLKGRQRADVYGQTP